MTNRGARVFFVLGTGLSALLFLALTIDSHRKIPALTNAVAIDATVIAGKDVYHAAGRRLPARVPQGPLALLLRGA